LACYNFHVHQLIRTMCLLVVQWIHIHMHSVKGLQLTIQQV